MSAVPSRQAGYQRAYRRRKANEREWRRLREEVRRAALERLAVENLERYATLFEEESMARGLGPDELL